MNETTAVASVEKKTEIAVFQGQLQNMSKQFMSILPPHISPERFERVVLNVVQKNPKLLIECDRMSLLIACREAAQDGLLPDGNLGAIVPFKGRAQWIPMVAGIRQLVQQSGEILDWDVTVTHQNDLLDIDLGTTKRIMHKPFMGAGDRGPINGVYSIANFKNGGQSLLWMTIGEVEAVRQQASRAKSPDSPWNVAAYYEEMVKKTAAKRHAKSLPMSSDLDTTIHRDDNLYEPDKTPEVKMPRGARLSSALDALAGEIEGPKVEPKEESQGKETVENENPSPATIDKSAGTTKVVSDAPAQQSNASDGPPIKVDKVMPTATGDVEGVKTIKLAIPKTEAEYKLYAKHWIDASADGATTLDGKQVPLRERWTHASEKTLRNKCNVSGDVREEIFEYMTKKSTPAAA